MGEGRASLEFASSGTTRRVAFGFATASILAGTAGQSFASVDHPDLGLAAGLTFLNTGSLGPTPRAILRDVIQAWTELERDPVRMAYGDGPDTVVSRADLVRGKAAKLLGCDADELMITTGTTSGMTILAQAIALNTGDHVLTTDQEHDGGSVGWRHLMRRRGVVIDSIAVSFDEQDAEAVVRRFDAAIRSSTRVISLSHIITSTGFRMPVREIAALAGARGLLCIVDGAQAVGALDVDVRALGCHAYATSGHKWLMGPKGTGLLFVSKEAGTAIAPVPWEAGRRYESNSTGVGPIPLAVGLGTAIDRLLALGAARVERRVQELRDHSWRMLATLPGVHMVGPPPGTPSSGLAACVLPDAVDSRRLRERLSERHKIVVKMIEKRFFNGIRLSPHIFNTEAEIDRCCEAIRAELRDTL